jgi:hypothetical protein
MSNTNTTVSNKSATLSMSDVDTLCETLVSRLNDGERVTLTALSNQFNATSAEIRKYLIDKFGSRISFQRGRTGGIRLA